MGKSVAKGRLTFVSGIAALNAEKTYSNPLAES